MTSDLAENEVAAMVAQGLKPTVRDIVRLNAIALRIQYGTYNTEKYALPRVAFLGSLALRQPTIAHELWLDRVTAIVDMDDQSYFACRLYVASRPAAALCDPLDRKLVKAEVEKCLADFGAYTLEAVSLALRYVWVGGGELDAERPAPRPHDDTMPDLPPDASIALGALHDGVAVKLGISLADLRSMTRTQLLSVIHSAVGMDGDAKGRAIGRARIDFFRTLDEIKARLEKERDAAAQAQDAKEGGDGDAGK
jgi:hypothetical protein